MEIEINQQHFTLHPSGAAYWHEQQVLLISDVHLGKIAHFRKHGLAIPREAIRENFDKMEAVVSVFNPLKVIFLGDLFHSKMNHEWDYFADWVSRVDAQVVLVEGNHDIISAPHYASLGIHRYPQLILDGFLLTHKPDATTDLFNFCGHIHPGIKLRDIGRQPLKLPCFFKGRQQLVFPAFGEFTGKYFLQPEEGDQVYALANDKVIRVK